MIEESNILVSIRVRPLNQKEINMGDMDVVRVEDNLIVILDPVQMEYEAENKKMLDVYHRSKEQQYAFDKLFRYESQDEIYEKTCKHLIKPVMNGYNATVFAYGPTGTGKTYTMLGNQEVMGLSVLTIRDMFEFINQDEENEYQVIITYVEIYNECIRDLLVTQSSYLELRDDPIKVYPHQQKCIKGITITGVQEYKAESTEQVMTLLHQGNRRRTTEATNANQTSSRSHAVFQIVVTARSKTKNTEFENFMGKLSLIDLAGSERGTVTENRGLRLREGAKINRSLLALANCINALGDKAKKGFFVPYRDSKLTRLLKDSLGGNCKTVMIANISPSSSQFEETINTLKYANRAKNIKTKQVANKKLVALHIAEYKNIITDLRSEIELLKQRLYERNTNPMLEGIEPFEEEQLVNNYVGKNKQNTSNGNCTCNCHRPEDVDEMRRIQETIFENFQERIQLRRALMEIEEQNAMNFLEIRKKQAEIMIWRKQEETNGMDFMVDENKKKIPEEIKSNAKSIQTLKTSSEKNIIKKELMGLQLIENINNAKRIRDQIPKKLKNKDKRDFLELEIKNHVLELQNIELEINLQIQEKTIADLKNIIDNQKKLIFDQKPDEDENWLTNQNDLDDPLFDDLLDEEDLIEVDPDDEDEELTELENFKEILIQQQQQLQQPMKHKGQQSPEQKTTDKRTVRIDQDLTQPKQQRDRSAPNHRIKQQQLQQKQQKQQEDLAINGVTLLENQEDPENDPTFSIQNKVPKKRDDSRNRQAKPQVPSQNLNFMITNQQTQQQQQLQASNQNSNKQIAPITTKQPFPPVKPLQPSQLPQPDLSLLNLKGVLKTYYFNNKNIMPLNNTKVQTKPPKKK